VNEDVLAHWGLLRQKKKEKRPFDCLIHLRNSLMPAHHNRLGV